MSTQQELQAKMISKLEYQRFHKCGGFFQILIAEVTISDIPLMCCKSSMIVYFHLHFIQMEKSQNPLKMHLFVFYLSYPQTIKYDEFMSASICLQNLNLSFNACRKLLLRLLKPWFSSAATALPFKPLL